MYQETATEKPEEPLRLLQVIHAHPLWVQYQKAKTLDVAWADELLHAGWTPHNCSIFLWNHVKHWEKLNAIYQVSTIGSLLCGWREALVVEQIMKELK